MELSVTVNKQTISAFSAIIKIQNHENVKAKKIDTAGWTAGSLLKRLLPDPRTIQGILHTDQLNLPHNLLYS